MGLNASERTYLAFLLPLRLWIGGYLLYQGIRKYLRDFSHADWIKAQIGDLDKVELYAWYKSFLVDVVAPNRELFGTLVMYGEILVGLCLVLGLLTRFSSAVGLFMLLNYYFGPGMARGGAVLGQQQTFIVSLVVLLLTNPGRTLGVDGFLFKRK
ncbi:MAG: DoxX family membrane protein [Deltaproteobacteria bacterium]|nr:DoxX family membrane protein [Deltaproteobacteria bacterium]